MVRCRTVMKSPGHDIVNVRISLNWGAVENCEIVQLISDTLAAESKTPFRFPFSMRCGGAGHYLSTDEMRNTIRKKTIIRMAKLRVLR